ncbi:MAG TPA: Lrp/AsnC family transcriptional regulator [Jatrophihabitantaceae bacterium]|nr:Lrp/AsnC family transcriptional regulator [Jatrophihabitantaceae bacterium]
MDVTVAVRIGVRGAGTIFAPGELEAEVVGTCALDDADVLEVVVVFDVVIVSFCPEPDVVEEQLVRITSTDVMAAVAASTGPRPWARMARSCQAAGMAKAPTDVLDELDARLLRELDAAPRVGVLELSRRLGVARATVQARLDRLVSRGIIATFAPTLDPVALGFQVTAFATLEIRQGRGAQVLDHLQQIAEVLEVHTITGQGDMLCRLVARSNDDLQQVLNRVTEFEQIVRTSTVIALSNPISHRVLPLVSP